MCRSALGTRTVPSRISFLVCARRRLLSVWMKIPGVYTSELLTQALSEGVTFIPGKYFFLVQTDGTEFLRLSFSYEDEKEIAEGIRRLGRVIEANL